MPSQLSSFYFSALPLAVRWNVASNIVVAWIVTLPATGVIGSVFYVLSGFVQTTKYILGTAIAELFKEIEADKKNQEELPKPTGVMKVLCLKSRRGAWLLP